MTSPNKESWVFWEDMWNPPTQSSNNSTESCCGEWNEKGECTCSNKIK